MSNLFGRGENREIPFHLNNRNPEIFLIRNNGVHSSQEENTPIEKILTYLCPCFKGEFNGKKLCANGLECSDNGNRPSYCIQKRNFYISMVGNRRYAV